LVKEAEGIRVAWTGY